MTFKTVCWFHFHVVTLLCFIKQINSVTHMLVVCRWSRQVSRCTCVDYTVDVGCLCGAFTLQEQLLFVTFIQTHCVFQNSPEVDDEGYSIRPEDELEEEDILSTVFNTWQFLSRYLARTGSLSLFVSHLLHTVGSVFVVHVMEDKCDSAHRTDQYD